MTRSTITSGLREARLIRRGDLKQFGKDLDDFHVRTDNPLSVAGSLVMVPAVGITKIGNALAGELSDRKADALGDGFLKYTMRDIRSVTGNTVDAVKNLLTLHPLRAAGNVVKGAFDGLDLVTDPFIDAGSGIFGHTQRKNSTPLSSAA